MADPGRQATRGTCSDAWTAGALAAVLLVGLVVRSLVTLAPPLVVGEDGAYYLVQVRALLRGGTLAFPDFPLLFYVQGSIAGLLALVIEQRAAIVAAVRGTDTFLPLALAVPVFLFARMFARPGDRSGPRAVAVALVGLVAVVSGNTLLMAGGMIKNAVALPSSFLFAFALYRWLGRGRPGSLVWAALWFALASLTHMGGLILSAAVAAGVLAVGLATPAARPRAWPPVVVLLGCLGGCLAIVHAFDPVRAARLVHAVLVPGWLFADSPAVLWLRGIPDPMLQQVLGSEEVWLGNALGVLGVVTLRRHGVGMDAPTRVLLIAATLVTFTFSSPLLRPDVLERLALIAYVPGMIPVVYLVSREAGSAVVVAPLALLVMLEGALAVKTLRVTALVPPAHEELVRFRSVLPPGRVIVITRPPLRWWVAWTMETRFSTRVDGALAHRDAYDAVLVLDEVRAGAFGVAHSPLGIGTPAAGVRDAARLRSEVVTTLAEGAYFRLSTVAPGASPLGKHDARSCGPSAWTASQIAPGVRDGRRDPGAGAVLPRASTGRSRSGLEAPPAAGGRVSEVDRVGCRPGERGVRELGVGPSATPPRHRPAGAPGRRRQAAPRSFFRCSSGRTQEGGRETKAPPALDGDSGQVGCLDSRWRGT